MASMHAGLAAIALAILSVGSGFAAGTAVVVDPEAVIQSAGQQRALVAGDTVEIGDLIQTANSGHVELTFDDGTKIVVGPGSSLLIQDYLLRGDGSAGDFAISALAGTFRFVSGKSAKDRYKITTPTGTIGIRGTEFDLVAQRGKRTQVLMYSGSTELCSRAGECTVIADLCELGEITRDGALSLGLTTTFGRDVRRALRAHFVYGGTQQSLSTSHQLRSAGSCLLSPFPLSPQFLLRLGQQSAPEGDAVTGAIDKPLAKGGGEVDGPVIVVPPRDEELGGDCAGNSGHNPGNSQNCNGKK